MAYIRAADREEQIVAAAVQVLSTVGVAGTTLRAVATQAGIPLGTLHYVFPSKDQMLRAVIARLIEDVVDEIATVLGSAVDVEQGLAFAIRHGLTTLWTELVSGHTNLQIMQYELVTYALRTPGQESLARWQYERYASVVAEWCQRAAQNSGETCAVPFGRLARVALASVDGLILQYVCDANESRSREDLDTTIDMIIAMAGIRSP